MLEFIVYMFFVGLGQYEVGAHHGIFATLCGLICIAIVVRAWWPGYIRRSLKKKAELAEQAWRIRETRKWHDRGRLAAISGYQVIDRGTKER